MKRPPLIATICTLCGIAVLCALGVWQLQRLEWKEAMLAEIAAQQVLDPFEQRLAFSDFVAGNAYRRGFVSGRYAFAQSVLLGPRTHDGAAGYHLYTPLVLDDDRAVLVNRGWVPEARKDDFARTGSMQINGSVAVAGMIMAAPASNFFTPENDAAESIWFRLDTALLEERSGVDLAPMVLLAEQSSPEAGGPLVRVERYRDIPNDHLEYAVFWFSLAVVLLVVFYLRFLRV